MILTLCTITKGDSELPELKRMIQSVDKYVDNVCITTNGTHTKTKKYLESKGYHHSHLPWNKDFSEQRNFNFSQAPKDTDYILWLDSDDILEGGQYLRRIAEIAKKKETDTVFFSYWYACLFDKKGELLEVETNHPRERLIRPGSITWKKRIHETPVELDGSDYTYSHVLHTPEKPHTVFPIAVVHTGADRNIPQDKLLARMERNREMLELELEQERERGQADPRTLLYLMKLYSETDEPETWTKCIELGEEYLSRSGWDEERAVCNQEMAKCYGKLGQEEKAVELLHEANENWPHNPLTYLLLSQSYYNLGLYKKMKHWLEIALNMGLEHEASSMTNIYQMKVLASELMLKLNLHVDKNVDKALEAAKMLYKENPTENNHKNVKYLGGLVKLNEACRNVDELSEYLGKEGENEAVFNLIESLPRQIQSRPFAYRLKNKYGLPRGWKKNEICYFANFGGSHMEKWDFTSLEKGIGGSETAVITLSREWAKQGYTVTVYGDPTQPGITEDFGEGKVIYQPYYAFNAKDKFNIFIQWRNNNLAGRVSAKKFYVDLHDVFHEGSYLEKSDAIDGVFVKSEYHKSLAPNVPDDKFIVVSNGISV